MDDDPDYPSRRDAERYLAGMLKALRELAAQYPRQWGHAAAIAERLEVARIEEVDRTCFYSILGELQQAQLEPDYATDCSWLTPLTGARSCGEAAAAWLQNHRTPTAPADQ